MAKVDRIQHGILGDINPTPADREDRSRRFEKDKFDENAQDMERDESMQGGSRHGETHHSGSRDVTEGVSGGLGTEVGGSRNYRQGSGASGGDIGNRPE
jgi:hypothetical protein